MASSGNESLPFASAIVNFSAQRRVGRKTVSVFIRIKRSGESPASLITSFVVRVTGVPPGTQAVINEWRGKMRRDTASVDTRRFVLLFKERCDALRLFLDVAFPNGELQRAYFGLLIEAQATIPDLMFQRDHAVQAKPTAPAANA